LLSMAKSAAKQLLIRENKYKGGRSFTWHSTEMVL
jgi:hypothetical protein